MIHGNVVVDIAQYRTKETRHRRRGNNGKKGTVFKRSGKIWVDFRYLGERVRESSGLTATKENHGLVRKQLDLIMAEIDNGLFEFAKRFPQSRKRDYFTELEGKTATKRPGEVLFEEYVAAWREAMEPGMTSGQIRDYSCIFRYHLLPQGKRIKNVDKSTWCDVY